MVKLWHQETESDFFESNFLKPIHSRPLMLLVVFALMPLNWTFESLKWRFLAKKVVKLSFWQALKGVMSGLALGFITPHGLGDYIGRVGQLSSKRRTRLIGAVLISRSVQMIPTIGFGAVGLFYLLRWPKTLLILMVSTILIVTIFITFRAFVRDNSSVPWMQKVKQSLRIVAWYSPKDLFTALALSSLRYTIFAIQFYVLIHVYMPSVSTQLKFAGVTWVFLAKSVVPTFNFLSDLGIREVSAVFFFEQFDVPIVPVIKASLVLWGINILIPTSASLPLIFSLKMKV